MAEAVARYLYKLMAYKDEYEVARLLLDPALTADIERGSAPGARYAYRLHPPVLRALGHEAQDQPRPLVPAGLRGSCRHAAAARHAARPVRRPRCAASSAQLIGEYRELVRSLLPRADAPRTTREIAEIAALPDMVRGYEEIKLANVAGLPAQQLQEKLDALAGGDRELAAAG